MTDAQIFQISGIALMAMGVAWVMNPKAFREVFKGMMDNKATLLLAGLSALVMGYLIVALHKTSSAVILILGWIALLKGLFIILADIN